MSSIRGFPVAFQNHTISQIFIYGIAASILALLAWRIWAFTVVPFLNPQRPRELPYWIPGLGHVLAYITDYNAVLEKGRKFIKHSKDPYSIRLAGKRLYVVTSPEDNAQLYRNTTTVSRDAFVKQMMISIGISGDGVDKMLASLPSHIDVKAPNSVDCSLEYHKRQLLPGNKEFDTLLQDNMIPGISKALTLRYAKGHLSSREISGGKITVSLLDVCEKIFIRDTGDVFFGTDMYRNNPDILDSFMLWERTNWKLLFGMPEFMSRDMLSARDNIVAHFTRYFGTPLQERNNASFYVKATEKMLRAIGCSEKDTASMFMLHFWAALGNVYKLAFWVTAHLASDSELLESIRTEVLPAAHGAQIDEVYVSEKCPKLDSLISEVLRLYATSGLIREVVAPTVVGGKMLEANSMLLVPYRELHLGNDTWGNDSLEFNPERFYVNPKLQKDKAYRPFGGGTQLCPGRILARRVVGYFVSLLVTRFEVDIDRESTSRFPRPDFAKPAAGIPLPREGDDIVLILRDYHDTPKE